MKRKYDYALSDHEGSSQLAKRNIIMAHSPATPNGEAWAVARNMKRGINTSYTYVHLVIDDKNIYQVGELGYVAWSAGMPTNNMARVRLNCASLPIINVQ